MYEQLPLLVARALHILSGVFWVGAVSLLARFVIPASRARPGDDGALVADLFRFRRLGPALGGAGAVNLVTGLYLYSGFYPRQDWNLASPGPAEAYAIGGILAATALGLGVVQGIGMLRRLRRNREQPSDPEMAAELTPQVAVVMRINMALLIIATILMAVGRYV